MTTTNRRSLDNWELRFGAMQVSLVIGVVLASMMLSFYFGYYTGQGVGVELALSSKASEAPRFPVSMDTPLAINRADSLPMPGKVDQEVFARLQERSSGVNLATAPAAQLAADVAAVKVEKSNRAENSLIDFSELSPKLPASAEKNVGSQLDEAARARFDGALVDAVGVDKGEDIAGHSSKAINQPAGSASSGDATEKQLAKSDVASASKSHSSGALKADVAAPLKADVAFPKTQPKETSKLNQTNLERGAAVKYGIARRGWYVQVAARERQAEAQQIFSKLQGEGGKLFGEQAQISGKTFYRVLFGPYESRAAAEQQLSKVKKGPKDFSKDAFLRQVK